MKFRYNFLENQLWRLKDEYSYEILEKFHTPQGNYGTDGFQISEKEWITFTLILGNENGLEVVYQTKSNTYQKTLEISNWHPFNYQITFEFTQADLIHQENN